MYVFLSPCSFPLLSPLSPKFFIIILLFVIFSDFLIFENFKIWKPEFLNIWNFSNFWKSENLNFDFRQMAKRNVWWSGWDLTTSTRRGNRLKVWRIAKSSIIGKITIYKNKKPIYNNKKTNLQKQKINLQKSKKITKKRQFTKANNLIF